MRTKFGVDSTSRFLQCQHTHRHTNVAHATDHPTHALVTAGVVSNISQCQTALNCAIARARSRKVSCATVYLIFISLLTLCLGS